MQKNLREGRVSYLSLYYDLEKAFDSVEHFVLLQSLFHAGINGKAWRLLKACCSNQTALVKSGSTRSDTFSITRGVQQGSVLSPTIFLIVMDKLLRQLQETSSGTSICGLSLVWGPRLASTLAEQLMLMMYMPLHPEQWSRKNKVRLFRTFPQIMA